MAHQTTKPPTERPGFIKVKHDLTDVYNDRSPRPLTAEYSRLDYKVPYHTEHFIAGLMADARSFHGLEQTTLVDVGCSYGYSALMLQHGVGYDTIRTTLLDDSIADDALGEALLACANKGSSNVRVVGLDVSSNAVDFCRRSGTHEAVSCCDLETDEIPTDVAELLTGANFILSSGVYGYISERTIRKLVDAVADRSALWICNFALTPLDYMPTVQALADFGFTTESAPVLFPHRRFGSKAERTATIDLNARAGKPTQTERDTGYLQTRLYISRPREVSRVFSLDDFWRRELPRHHTSVLNPDPQPLVVT